jgi:hypothetical protein
MSDDQKDAELHENIGYIKASLDHYMPKIEDLCKRMARIEKEVSTAKAAVRILKTLGLIAIAFLTFQLGDIKTLWHSLMNGV